MILPGSIVLLLGIYGIIYSIVNSSSMVKGEYILTLSGSIAILLMGLSFITYGVIDIIKTRRGLNRENRR